MCFVYQKYIKILLSIYFYTKMLNVQHKFTVKLYQIETLLVKVRWQQISLKQAASR